MPQPDDKLTAAQEISYLRAVVSTLQADESAVAFDLGTVARRFDRALAALDSALAEHREDPGDPGWCTGCAFSSPCATVRAITTVLLGEDKAGG